MNSVNRDRLLPSSADMRALVPAVAERIRIVHDMYLRQWRIPINTKPITRDLERFNSLMERYETSDFRHTDSEKKATQILAQWTIDQKSALCGQPTKKLQWTD